MYLKFFYSPGSRYSYLALSQVPSIERDFDVEFDWVPVVGSRIRQLRGVDPFAGQPQSEQYNWSYRERDASAWADLYGIEFHEPQDVVFDSNLLGRGAIVAKRRGAVREYSWQLANKVFGESVWPIDEKLVVDTARSLGMPAPEFATEVTSDELIDAIEQNCRSAVANGVFGTPSFLVGSELIWGNDRLPLLRHALEKARSS